MIIIFMGMNALIPTAHADANDKIFKIEQFVEEQMEISQIPGISLVIVEKGKTFIKKVLGTLMLRRKHLLLLVPYLNLHQHRKHLQV